MSQSTEAVTVDDHRLLNKSDARTLGLSSLGGALEFYDFIVFVFYAKIISEQFFPKHLDPFWAMLNTWGIFAAGYFFRPLGGIVMAHFGDKLGRKKMFTLSILMMSLPTMFIGLLPNFSVIGYAAPLLLLVARAIQGIAIGGEIPAAWTYVSEHVPSRHVGMANGALCAGLNIGILIGSLVALVIEKSFGSDVVADWAWRIAFVAGGVMGLITMHMRRVLHETPIFQQMRARKQLYKGVPLKAVLTQHSGAVVLSMLLTWVLTACIMVALLSTPQLMSQGFGIPKPTAFAMQSGAILAGTVGCVAYGVLCDRIGVGNTLLLAAVALVVSSVLYYTNLGSASIPMLTVWYLLMGFATGIAACVPTAMAKSFPAPVRLSGIAFSYNVCYAICGAATFPLLTILAQYTPIAGMYYLIGLSVLAVLCGLYVRRLTNNTL